MDQITLKANINECIVENWQSNTGEVNARVMNIEMCEDLCSCARQFVTFELADGTVYESLVVDGKAKIPIIEKPQFIKIGLYAENSDGEKRYSSRPANVYVNAGSYNDGAEEPPKPTPSDYSALLSEIAKVDEKIAEGTENVNKALADLKKGTIKVITEQVNLWELETGIYYLDGGWSYTKNLGASNNVRHMFFIYKPTYKKAVRYIHFCGDYQKDILSRIECGYTDGTTLTEYYFIDSSQVTNDPNNDALGTKILNSAGVKNYVKESIETLKTDIQGELDEIGELVGGETGESEVITETIITEGTYAFDDYSIIGDGRRYYYHNFKNMPSATTATENDMFILKFNGETYKLSWIFVGGEFLLGNLVIMGAPEGSEYDTGENFCICYNDETTLSFYTTLPKGDYTVSLEKIVGGAE